MLEEFALECGVPIGLKFIEDDREYLAEAVADEWRALTWATDAVSQLVMGERMSGDTKRRNRWVPRELARAARVVRQGVGVDHPALLDRQVHFAALRALLPPILVEWDETRMRDLWAAVQWNKAGRTAADLEALCGAMRLLKTGGEPVLAHIALWGRSAVAAVAHKSAKVNKDRLPKERFLDACEPLAEAYKRTVELLWQDAVLSVAERVERAMKQQRVAGFDEMIAHLQRAVTSPETGERLKAELSKRYDAVLVDEFQDTDWAQWTIFATTFAIKPLVLVGDPKQSIYGFRGADITAYRDARRAAEAIDKARVESLDTNYRSDQALVDSMAMASGRNSS